MGNENLQDPSENVKLLVGNAVKYLESLQKTTEQYFEEKLKTLTESSRREHAAESNRIDELRKGDIESIRIANVQAVKTAELLNAQMLENAEVLRKSVEGTAVTIATQLSLITTQQDARFVKLEQAQWENQGKSVASPDLVGMVADLINAQNVSKGKTLSLSPIIGLFYAVGGAILTYLILQAIAGKL